MKLRLSASGIFDAGGMEVSGYSLDSRTLQPGDLFFALRGDGRDGHEFVGAAFDKGAAAAVVERDVPVTGTLLRVPDTLAALQSLAAWARAQWGGTVIGVTGSAGKTTTKDVIADLLATQLAVGKTVGNWNNHLGVPLSILRLPDQCRAAVLEMGMNHAGELRRLAEIAGPDIGVVTNVGYAHIEFFDSIQGIAAAKRELIEALPSSGTAILNADDPLVADFEHPRVIRFGLSERADIRAEQLEFLESGSRFRVDGVVFETSLAGRHGVLNILAGLAAARVCGIAPKRLTEAVRSFSAGKMRGERLERDGIIIWNDCYNSNPEAARAMLDVLSGTAAARRVAVLGEMLELGHSAEALHREVGNYVAARGIDVLIGIRGAARHMVNAAMEAGMSDGAAHFFESPAEAGDFARALLRPGDAALFKGSRGVAVEKALEKVLG